MFETHATYGEERVACTRIVFFFFPSEGSHLRGVKKKKRRIEQKKKNEECSLGRRLSHLLGQKNL